MGVTGYDKPLNFLRDERTMESEHFRKIALGTAATALFLLFSQLATAGNKVYSTALAVGYGNEEIVLNLEIAACIEQRITGLQGRTSLEEGAGMLFLIDPVDKVSMWMKDTVIPLDILFVDAGNRVVGLVESTTPMSLRSITSPQVVAAVVEVNAGFIRRSGVRVGHSVRYELPEEVLERDCDVIG
jgi:uncharacterized membrane protein (UPF0127 family)